MSIRTVLSYALLAVGSIIVAFPLLMALSYSLMSESQIATFPPPIVPVRPTLNNYADVLDTIPIGRYLLNSFVVSTAVVIGQLITASLAAYAFSFLVFRGRQILFFVFLSTLMIPWEATIIPNYMTIRTIGWLDTYQGLAVPFLATGFGAFLLRQAFLQVPRDLQDAAAMDGYGHLRFMVRVAVPLARPAVAALTVFAFLAAWNQYLWPLLVTEDDRLRTVQIGLKQLRQTSLNEANITFAGAIIAAVPLLILLIFFQKQLVRGLTAGAVKG